MPAHVVLPDPAAVLPGEAEMLAGVVADLSDHDPKLVYADWLEEQGDPRGPCLREFVQALRDGTPLPSGDGLSDSWLETTGIRLLERIRENNLDKHRDRLLPLARPVLEITAGETVRDSDIPLGASKLGGRPAMPKGTPWPRCEAGPIRFFCQFNLAELRRTVAGRALPPAGLLSFFGYQNWNDDTHGHFSVALAPPRRELALLEPPDDLDENQGRPKPPAMVTLRESLDLPSNNAPWQEKLGLSRDYEDDYWDLLVGQRLIAPVLFGYARPRHLCSDPIPGLEWQQLLSLTSDDERGWGWGDAHELFWYIRTADLGAGRFDGTQAESG